MGSGVIHHKEAFLQQIAKNLGRERMTHEVERPVWKYQPQHGVYKGYSQNQLVDVLKKQCIEIHTHVEIADSIQAAPAVVEMLIKHMGAKSIVGWDDPRFEEYGLDTYFEKAVKEGLDFHKWNPEIGEENIRKAERADLGITFSDITLAESGTVVLFSDNGKGRSVSLLPTNYMAIIPKSTIVPRMTQATQYIHQMQQEKGIVPSCINFISGPSNSADIEMNLVVGVHGPIQAFYIIVNDM